MRGKAFTMYKKPNYDNDESNSLSKSVRSSTQQKRKARQSVQDPRLFIKSFKATQEEKDKLLKDLFDSKFDSDTVKQMQPSHPLNRAYENMRSENQKPYTY